MSFLSFASVLYGVMSKLSGNVVPGWTSLVAVVGFLGGIQLIVLGVMGEYIDRIYDEVKQRPLYLVRDRTDPYDVVAADQ